MKTILGISPTWSMQGWKQTVRSMRSFSFLFLLVIFFQSSFLIAQQTCGTNEYMERLYRQYPEYESKLVNIEQHIKNYLTNTITSREIITIPVVVNIIYKTAEENLSEQQIRTQIEVLNEDFRRQNQDQNDRWPQAADVQIQFCLATTAPSGHSTNGIRRKKTQKSSFSTNDAIKRSLDGGLDPWPTDEYLNIWVGKLGNGLLGYAQFPGGPKSSDGVVIDYRYFGKEGTTKTPFHLGRTCTHEVGHWLNLRHLWGKGGCATDDFVEDTPNSFGPRFGCPTSSVTCGSQDMTENFMNYTNDGCMNLFTEGQKMRMQALFVQGGARFAIKNSIGCIDQNELETTPSQRIDCGSVDLMNSRLFENKIILHWNASENASRYTVSIRQISPYKTKWKTYHSASNHLILQHNHPNARYEWKVRVECDANTFSAWTTVKISSSLATSFSIFPNPVNEELTIYFDPPEQDLKSIVSALERPNEQSLKVEIYDLNGYLIFKLNFKIQPGSYFSFPVSQLTSGVYFLKIKDQEEQVLGIERFVKF